MYRYQIRIPARMLLQDLMEEITSEAWIILNHRFEGEFAGQYKEFQNLVRLTMTPYLERFYLCGTSDICTDEARKVFGNCKLDSSSLFPETRIYHLMLPGTFKEFLDELTSKTLDVHRNFIKRTGPSKGAGNADIRFSLSNGQVSLSQSLVWKSSNLPVLISDRSLDQF